MGIALATQEFYDLSGGMNDKDSDTSLLDSEWSFLRNVEFNRDGGVSTRLGGIRLNLDPINSGARFLLDHFYALDNGIQDRLVVSGDSLFRLNNGAVVLIAGGFDPTHYWSAAQLSNRVALGNGIDPNQKWDGTNLFNLSIVAPVDISGFAAAVIAGGTLPVGSYTYTYTYRNLATLDESNPVNATVVAASAGANNTIRLTNFDPSTDPQVDQIVIYRSLVNTTTPLFEIATKPNTAALFDDNGFVDGVHELEEDNDVAPTGGIFATFLGRLYILVNDTLFFSKPFNPSSFPAVNQQKIGRDGQVGTCLLPIGNNALVIGKIRSTWILPGDPLDPAVPAQFSSLHGIVNNRAASVFEDSVLFIDQSLRPHALTPTELANDERRVEYIGRRISKTFDSIDTGGKEDIKVETVVIEDRKQWLVSLPLNTSTTDSLAVLDFNVTPKEQMREPGAWSVWTNLPAATLKVWPDTQGIPRLWRGDYIGHIWQQYFGESDGAEVNGTATSGTITTLTDLTQVSIDSTATAGGVNTLTDTTQTMGVNAFLGMQIFIKSGTGAGQVKTILSNTATVFTVDSNWTVVPDATSQYQVGGYIVNGLKGVPILIVEGTGIGQDRIISSNTADTVTVSSAWFVAPDATSVYAIGGIEFAALTNWKSLGSHEDIKRLWFLWFNFSQIGTYPITVKLFFDFDTTVDNASTFTIQSIANTLWGFFLWGSGIWGALTSVQQKIQTDKYFHHIRVGFFNSFAGQPVLLNGLATTAQGKGLFTT